MSAEGQRIENIDNLKLYLGQMELIKRRMESIRLMLENKTTTGFCQTNVEFMTLQIRKIIELIALSNLVANKEKYSEYRERFATDWNAKKIFQALEKVNLEFYPKPIKVEHTGTFDGFVDLEDGFMTRDDAEEIYNSCSGLIHSDNPFGTPVALEYYEQNILVWYNKILRLTERHVVKILDDAFYFVVMNDSKTGNASGNIFEKAEE